MVAVTRHGCTVFRSNAGTVQTKFGTVIKLAPKGWPDITGFRHSDGKMILIEVKNETGKLREDQIKFQKFIEDKPVLYGVCRSVEDAIELIESNQILQEFKGEKMKILNKLLSVLIAIAIFANVITLVLNVLYFFDEWLFKILISEIIVIVYLVNVYIWNQVR